MAYTPPDNNLAPIDFALKTSSKEEDKNLRREARMMEKVQRAAHCVQIIHSSGKSPLDPPNPDDSSDGATDAESSGDESVDAQPPPRPPRASRSLAERQAKLQKHTNRVLDNNWLVAVRVGRVKAIDEARHQGKPIPKPHWKFPDPMLDLDRRDFIFMEYLPLGDLQKVICRIAEDNPNMLIPNKILWSFWLCLVRACIAMAYPPRKFHPMRKRDANPRQYRGLERRTWDFDPKRLLLEEIPPEQKRWRKKRMVHMDIDPTNSECLSSSFSSFQTMWQLITYYKPPRPPRLRTRLVRDQELRSYSLLLDEEKYRDVDFELRSTIFNCLRHVPSERPSLQFLLDQALKGVARRSTGDATEGEIRGWVQRYVYDA